MKLWAIYSLYALGVASGLTLTSVCTYHLYRLSIGAANRSTNATLAGHQRSKLKIHLDAQQQMAVQTARAVVETRRQAVEAVLHERFELLIQDQSLTNQLFDLTLTAAQRGQIVAQKEQLTQQLNASSTALREAKMRWETANASLELVLGY